MKRKLTAVLIAATMAVLTATGCNAVTDASEEGTAKEEAKSEEDLHIVFVTPLLASDVWLVAKEGFDAATEEFGFTGDWVGPSKLDVDSMIKQIEIAIAEGADGIITCGLNPEGMVPVMNQADEAGIPVVLVNADKDMEAPYFAYIGTDAVALGEMAAEEVVEKLDGEAPHTIYVGSTITNSSVIDSTNGYKKVFEKVEGYVDLGLEENNDDLDTSVKLWQNLFATYPDINVCANVAPAGAIGAAQVADEMGIGEDLIIMSMDDTAEVLDLIREGKIYGTMSQNYYRMGYMAAKWIVEYKTEGKVPEEKIVDSGTVFINKDNVETFHESLRDQSTWK